MDNRFIAIYENENEATSAVENLKEQGYTSDQISVVAKKLINYQMKPRKSAQQSLMDS